MSRLALAMIATAAASTAAVASAAPPALPRNWDDRYLDLATEKGALRPTLAVLPFTIGEGVGRVGELHAGDILATALFKTGRFELVERAKLYEVLAEQKLGQSGKVDVTTAARVGQLTGASIVVFGTVAAATQQMVDKFAYDLVVTDVRVEARAVDTSTSKLVFTESASGRAEAKVVTDAHGEIISGARNPETEYVKAATAAVLTLSEKLAENTPVVGFVVSVDGERIVTDVGSERELAKGQRLVVLRPTSRLVHPVTKKALGWEKEILGEGEVEAVELSTSRARVRKPVAPMQPGDIVVAVPRSER
ncbi:MAG TPA: CsgG/HfaB family protein [Anaeromyxobacter sp.]|nr:CsgG/HfaB family protein [Anaeromyxobacter sp.]